MSVHGPWTRPEQVRRSQDDQRGRLWPAAGEPISSAGDRPAVGDGSRFLGRRDEGLRDLGSPMESSTEQIREDRPSAPGFGWMDSDGRGKGSGPAGGERQTPAEKTASPRRDLSAGAAHSPLDNKKSSTLSVHAKNLTEGERSVGKARERGAHSPAEARFGLSSLLARPSIPVRPEAHDQPTGLAGTPRSEQTESRTLTNQAGRSPR